jgi:hypothetical protein
VVTEDDLFVSNGLDFGVGILYPNSVLSLYVHVNRVCKEAVLYAMHGPEIIRFELNLL